MANSLVPVEPSPAAPQQVNQSRARADGDIVAGSKYVNLTITAPQANIGVVEQLLKRLQDEIAKDATILHTVESLKTYYEKKSLDGVDGLEAKLSASGRDGELLRAYDRKEQFAKLLDTWSMYASAQEIFAFLLAQAEYLFQRHVSPMVAQGKTASEVDDITEALILNPTIEQCGASVFVINHNLALGMIYWLAEQCYVRWHK